MADGSEWERKLLNTFRDEYGWDGLRTGASGSATDRELPDLLVGNGHHYWAIEAKYRSSKKQCYVDEEKLRDIEKFATVFGAHPMLTVRYSTRLDGVSTADWWVEPTDLPRHVFTKDGRKASHSMDTLGALMGNL